jgi:hypothetical protein|tara:strand:- start:421 stop:789 length:369 start_codon:yes stop_codon:yes gene_type:complete
MKALKHENLLELKGKVLDLITRTSVEIGHRSDAKTLAALSTIFSEDLINEKRFGNMTFNQVIDAFRLGVRFGKEEPFLNIRTFYRWLYAHKKVIDNAWYEVHTLGKPKEQTLYYQEPLKLIR